MANAEKGLRKKPVTQKDIADRVGVTQQLVALALKGSPAVSEVTRERIQAVAAEIGYSAHANRPARALAAARHGTRIKNDIVAVMFENLPNVPVAETPYFMPLIDGIEIEAGEKQTDLFLVRKNPAGLPWLITESWVDGVILVGSHNSVGQLEKLNLPVITLGSHVRGTSGITPDDELGTRLATQHLLDQGHKRIAYLGPEIKWPSAEARWRGYDRVLRELQIVTLFGQLVESTLMAPLEQDGYEGMIRLLDREKFTALVCHNDPIAMGAIRAAQERGLRVPEDISITGFDDVSLASKFSPAITSISYSSVEMGRSAVRMLLDGNSEVRHEKFPVELQIRESTGPLPQAT